MAVDFQTLLPGNATPWEKAVEQTSGERWLGVDVDIIRRARNPWTCPEHLLNFLAFERSVDVWDPEWPIEKKRWVVANWLRLQRLKGTEAGLRAFAQLQGGEVLKVITPPAKTFLSPATTPEERQAYLQRFPQLRVYPFTENGQARYGSYAGGGGYGQRKSFVGALFPADLATRQRTRRDAKLYDPQDDSLVDLTARVVVRFDFNGKATEFEEIALPPVPGTGIYLGQSPKDHPLFFGLASVDTRIISMRVDRSYGYAAGQTQYQTVKTGLAPIDVNPELVADRGQRTRGQLFPRRKGGFLTGKYLPKSTAWQRMYERTYLFDASRVPEARRAWTFLGATRLGMPPHHAEAKVAIRDTRPTRAVGRFVSGFLCASSQKPLNDVRDAMGSSLRLSDKVAIDTKTRRILRAGDHIASGAVIGGITAA